MTAKLTPEQASALHAGGDAPLPVIDPHTNQLYFLVDQETMASLQQKSDLQAIEAGIADLQAGRTMSLEESQRRTQAALREKFPT
jgi:hypothetical protein